ncbi:MAG: DNRLRE domain-containing protein [Polyangiaceae bacterium]|nr:DNRLRE domain-containing protein [Polyangiaceae bacterium]
MRRSLLLAGLLTLAPAARAADVLSDPLSGSTTGQQNGGTFVSGGGWQAGQQITWDLGTELTEGGMSIEVTNWDPNSDSPQHQFDKQQVINMYQAAYGSPHQSDADSPKKGFFNIRTGASYDNLFKFLSSTAGFDPPPSGRHETRIKKPLGFIDSTKTYTIKVEWKATGEITSWLDAEQLVTHAHGTPFRLRHVFIGTDNAPAGTYGPQKDVIYKNLKVWGTASPVPDAGAGGSGGSGGSGGAGGAGGGAGGPATLSFEPVADTYTDPLDPGASHGTDTELRAGGDGSGGLGRIIFLRFNLKGVGQVQSAKLYLKAMNAGGGGDLRAVTDQSWTEPGTTHQNKPAHGAQVIASLPKVQIDGVYFFDVTSAVKGDGLVSFAITSTDGDGCGYNSREHAGTHPELVIESAGPAGTGGSGGGGGGAGVAGAGAGGAGNGGGGGNPAAGGTTDADDDGCGCRAPGAPAERSAGLAFLTLLAALAGLRRRVT